MLDSQLATDEARCDAANARVHPFTRSKVMSDRKSFTRGKPVVRIGANF